MNVSPNLHGIPQQANLAQVIEEEHEAETWANQEFTELDIGREIRKLPNRKAHGNDGIPGESYKATRQWAVKP